MEKEICLGDNPKGSGIADRGEVIYNHCYQEHETEPQQFVDEKFVVADEKNLPERLK